MSLSVCLIAPGNCSMADPRIAPPLGCLYLAAAQRNAGLGTPVVIDLNVACYPAGPEGPKGHTGGDTHDFSLARSLSEVPTGCDVYGFSLASMQLATGVPLARALRQREGAGVVLVAGGAHASAMPEDLADDFDVVIKFEGEAAWVALLHALVDKWDEPVTGGEVGPTLAERLTSVGGFAGRVHAAAGKALVIDGKQVDPLDDAPIPARDLLDFSRYTRRIAGKPATNLLTSRGCPARCMFCSQESIWQEGLRLMTPARVLAEVDSIYETTGIRNILFLDDSLTACSTARMKELCDGLAARGIAWRGWTRANLIARDDRLDMLKYMHKSGFVSCCVGVEAGSDKVLRALAKQTTVEQNRAAIRNLKAAGIKARCSIMVGNPTETWDDVQALVDFVAEVQPDDWILSSLVPLPGTPSWDKADEFGIEIDAETSRRGLYADVFIVGGNEQSGGGYWRYKNGVTPSEIQDRHDYVQESLLRLCPRDRQGLVS